MVYLCLNRPPSLCPAIYFRGYQLSITRDIKLVNLKTSIEFKFINIKGEEFPINVLL